MNKNKIGGVSYESDRNAYRGEFTISGKRYRTQRYPTRIGAVRALNRLIKTVGAGSLSLVTSRL